MSWLDEAIAKQSARNASPDASGVGHATDRDSRMRQQTQAFDSLVQQLLTDYGERAIGKTFRGRRFGTLLEAPGHRARAKGDIEHWDWHWHLHSYVPSVPGLEIHPQFDDEGAIVAFTLKGGAWQEACAPTEDALRESLVHAFLALHSTR